MMKRLFEQVVMRDRRRRGGLCRLLEGINMFHTRGERWDDSEKGRYTFPSINAIPNSGNSAKAYNDYTGVI